LVPPLRGAGVGVDVVLDSSRLGIEVGDLDLDIEAVVIAYGVLAHPVLSSWPIGAYELPGSAFGVGVGGRYSADDGRQAAGTRPITLPSRRLLRRIPSAFRAEGSIKG